MREDGGSGWQLVSIGLNVCFGWVGSQNDGRYY